MKTMDVLIYKNYCHISKFIFMFCFLTTHSIHSFILVNKMHEYGNWILTSYQLYTKTNKLVTFQKKYHPNFTACEHLNSEIFSYKQFQKAADKILFYKRLKLLQKTWESWSIKPTQEWAWEYGIILFSLYKAIFEKKIVETSNKKTFFKSFSIEAFWLYINFVNNQILSLPLEAILQTIDLLAEAIPIFFDEYQTSAKEISLKWVKKYIWALIITGIPLLLKIMIIFKNYYDNQKNNPIGLAGHSNTHFLEQNMPHQYLEIRPTLKPQADNKPDSVPHIQGSNHLSMQLTRAL